LFLPEDIDLSYRAGADAVLLIASILDLETLMDLYTRAKSLGMDVLFEIHSWEDAQKASKIKPDLTGINSRDLRTFQTDPLLPMKTRSWVDYPTTLVYESGILRSQDALFAGENGFHGILVGEGVVRRPQLVAELRRDFKGLQGVGFWAKLFTPWVEGKVLVKFCGFTRVQDVLAADKLGVDLLGFILAPSKRQVSVDFIRSLPKTRAQKVGVLVLDEGSKLPQEILELLGDGALDALQLHGKEDPQLLDDPGLFAYKALSLGKGSDDQVSVYQKTLAPRVLFDAYSPDQRGGTGLSIDPQFLEPYIHLPLWLAGGLTPQNILSVKKEYPVEPVDVSSGIESEPGIKDLEKMKAFLRELRHGE